MLSPKREEYQMWSTNRLFRNVSTVARDSDVIFVGIGALGRQSPIFKDGFIDEQQLEELTARGGVEKSSDALLMLKAMLWKARSTR